MEKNPKRCIFLLNMQFVWWGTRGIASPLQHSSTICSWGGESAGRCTILCQVSVRAPITGLVGCSTLELHSTCKRGLHALSHGDNTRPSPQSTLPPATSPAVMGCYMSSQRHGLGRCLLFPWDPHQHPRCRSLHSLLYSPRSKPPGLPVQSLPAHRWGDACGPTHGTGQYKTPS